MTAATGIEYQPLTSTFGARVHGLDLTQPLTAAERDTIASALHRHRVLLFRGQQLTAQQIVDVSRTFGTVELQSAEPKLEPHVVPGHPEVLMISNIFADGRPIGLYNNDNEEWHADYSWATGRTNLGAALYAMEAPAEGGATLFADATTAYDDLADPVKQAITDLHAVLSLSYLHERQNAVTTDKPEANGQAEEVPDVIAPLVRTHPVTGRRSLLLGTMEIRGIAELEDEPGRALLDELTAHVAQPRYRFRQQWQVGDLVVWDNHAVLHAATYCDRHRFRRLLYRTTFG